MDLIEKEKWLLKELDKVKAQKQEIERAAHQKEIERAQKMEELREKERVKQ